MDVLRFITAGSVDDGKSTLIGRLLHDSRSILIDQLEALKRQSRNRAEGEIDLALLTDGLRAEREQGITIDVAYKYFSTPRRKFIIADAPGHIQYTPNMVTGASNADLAVILVDAEKGVVEQTRRHSIIAALLGIPRIVVAVNKMDLVGYAHDHFIRITHDYAAVAEAAELGHVTYVPISAMHGDNIVERSTRMPWYGGSPLLRILEDAEVGRDLIHAPARFPVQYVIRPRGGDSDAGRGYAGKITSGIYRRGDRVTILPSGIESTITRIEIGGAEAELAFAPQSALFYLADDIDLGRGDMIVHAETKPHVAQQLDVLLCWMGGHPLRPGERFLMQINSRQVRAMVDTIDYRVDVNSLRKLPYEPASGGKNDILRATIRTASPIPYDPYRTLRGNGAAILIDDTSNATVGAVMIQGEGRGRYER